MLTGFANYLIQCANMAGLYNHLYQLYVYTFNLYAFIKIDNMYVRTAYNIKKNI